MNIKKISKILCLAIAGTANAEDLAKTETMNTQKVNIVKTEGVQETIDSEGTESKAKLYKSTKTGSDGSMESSTIVESTKDPKGLGNKTSMNSKIRTKEDGKGSYQDEIDTSSVDAKGTAHSKKEEKEYIRNSDGTSKSVYKEKIINDPKGLNNSSKKVIDETIVRDANGNIIKDQSDNVIDETMPKK